jgi:hypothetical protein
MAPTNIERRSLLIQFTFLFLLTSAVILLALFFTRDEGDEIGGGDQEQQLYTEFRNFDKLRPDLLRLVDTVNMQVTLMMTQNGQNTSAAIQAATYIDRFDRFTNTQNDTFAMKVTEMLRQYMQTAAAWKTAQDGKRKLDDEFEECQRDRQMALSLYGPRNRGTTQ